jgi:hypothetical protein
MRKRNAWRERKEFAKLESATRFLVDIIPQIFVVNVKQMIGKNLG